MTPRAAAIRELAALVPVRPDRAALFAIDGPDGSGKTVLAEELAAVLRRLGRDADVVHIDDFHAPRTSRYRLGRDSPDGFFLDSYDYPAFARAVIGPVLRGAPYVPGVWDVEADRPWTAPRRTVARGGVVVVEGIFLHRDELSGSWDGSVFVDVPFEIAAIRMAERDGSPRDPTDPRLRRYVEGQRRYFAQCDPSSRATVVLDNSDLSTPRLVRRLPF